MSNIVFAFGRMNPPTTGHNRLVSTIIETAKANKADHVLYLSQTQKPKTDPLDWKFKRRVCETAFKGVNISSDINIKNPFIALEHLKEHYDKIFMVTGSDQIADYEKFRKYTDDWGADFEVVSAGNRISESAGVEGISASKLRQYAELGDKSNFFKGLPKGLNEGIMELVYRNTRKGMKKP
jgi:nicotinic acid mononucleotide adenylyltransferase